MRRRFIAGQDRHVNGWKKDARPIDPHLRLPTPGPWAKLNMPSSAEVSMPSVRVEDQGAIGSCVCNAASSMMEFIFWKQSGGDARLELSRLWLYARVRESEGVPLTEDAGCFNVDAMKVLALQGCPLESLWPYDGGKWSVRPPVELDREAVKQRSAFYYNCPNLWALKASLSQGFPVMFGFTVPRSMFDSYTAQTGNVKEPAQGEPFVGGHAVLAVGYDDAYGAVKFMNSWSRQWGDEGYGRLPYKYFDLGLASDMWTLRSVIA